MRRHKLVSILAISMIGLAVFSQHPFGNLVSDEKTTALDVRMRGASKYLDIAHRYYNEVVLKSNEEAYVKFSFDLLVQDAEEISYALTTTPYGAEIDERIRDTIARAKSPRRIQKWNLLWPGSRPQFQSSPHRP